MSDPDEALQRTQGDGAPTDPAPLSTISVQALTGRVQKVREARKKVMEEDVHYGVIPGTGDKPTLKKPGAEILLSLFQLDPEPDMQINDLEGEHREYIVRGPVYHIPSGNRVGKGFGSCSTKETKYRYRYIDETTDVTVPGDFWDTGDDMSERDNDILREALKSEGVDIPSGAQTGVDKTEDGWKVTVKSQGENPDIADVYNTCLKMAKKRWMVDVALTATHASELFTQDVEDLKDLSGASVGGHRKKSSTPSKANITQDPDVEYVQREGVTVTKGQAEKIDQRDEALEERSGEGLAAAILAVEGEMEDWPSETLCEACDSMLDTHRQRLQDASDAEVNEEAGKATGAPSAPKSNERSSESGETKTRPSGGEEKATGTDGGSKPPSTDLASYDGFPTGFPGASYLLDAGIETPAELDQYMDSGEPLTEIDGIGEARADKIQANLEDLRNGWFEDDLPF